MEIPSRPQRPRSRSSAIPGVEARCVRSLFTEPERLGLLSLVGDDDELGLAAGKANLDAAGLELAGDLQRGLAEEVEEVEVEGRREGLAQPSSGVAVASSPSAAVAPSSCWMAWMWLSSCTVTSV